MRLLLSQAQDLLSDYVEYGMCPTDPRCTREINLAIERLMPILNPEKTIKRMQFDVVDQVVTMPRQVKTVLGASTSYPSCTGSSSCGPGCTAILSVKSVWYEMMPGGPVGWVPCATNVLMDLGTGFSTFADPSTSQPFTLRLYADIPQTASEGFIVINGTDVNGNLPFSYVNNQYIPGQALNIPTSNPTDNTGGTYNDTPQMFTQINSITKPVTQGRLRLFGVDSTGTQFPLAVWEPDELNPDYRRYLVTWVGPSMPSILTVLVKLRYVYTTSPYSDLLITNVGALRNALQAMKYERAGAFDQATAGWSIAKTILETETRDFDGEQGKTVQMQEWFTGGDIASIR
jgi:hypothetical protein